jgi:hypothetical protein
MILANLGPGQRPDVAFDASGVVHVVWGHPDGRLLWHIGSNELETPRQLEPSDCYSAFPRIAWPWLVYNQGPSWHAILRNLETGEQHDLGEQAGLTPAIGAGYTAVIREGPRRIDRIGPALTDHVLTPTDSTGLSRIDNGRVVTTDEDRQSMGGGTNPCWALDLVTLEAEAVTDARRAALCRLTDGRELRLWVGQDSREPRCAADGKGQYAVVTWGDTGVRLALLSQEDFVPTPIIPTPLPTPPAKRLPPKIEVRTVYPIALGPGGAYVVMEWRDGNNPTDKGKLVLINGSLRLTLYNECGSDQTAKERKVGWKP